jgi:hypothetical protein
MPHRLKSIRSLAVLVWVAAISGPGRAGQVPMKVAVNIPAEAALLFLTCNRAFLQQAYRS